ncbi:putative quinol monooxygenase [Herbaspirillum lusitanum]|jgi:quinol monooxygenase YgiN|uniref:Quinol monooxygenase n=1 Tax=Herbaspirillum lusitanum TaxID=213312 RepID=A0ABW9AF27_9BURK
MLIIAVTFTIKPEHINSFRAAMLKNASTSLAEEDGCLTFDVCEAKEGEVIFLYERYTDSNAFDLHLRAPHFLEFDKLVTPWIRAKQVDRYSLISEE